MKLFTKIPKSTFDDIQLDAGVLLNKFDPDAPDSPADEDIICATTGGINATCIPTYSDMGEDVDNCPNGMLELKHLDGWDCKMTFTALGVNENMIRIALGAADVSEGVVTPRMELAAKDFISELWWVGDKGDGGLVAICLKNALSTGGFSLQTTKNGKGQMSVEITGHVSIEAQDEVPMEFYVSGKSEK